MKQKRWKWCALAMVALFALPMAHVSAAQESLPQKKELAEVLPDSADFSDGQTAFYMLENDKQRVIFHAEKQTDQWKLVASSQRALCQGAHCEFYLLGDAFGGAERFVLEHIHAPSTIESFTFAKQGGEWVLTTVTLETPIEAYQTMNVSLRPKRIAYGTIQGGRITYTYYIADPDNVLPDAKVAFPGEGEWIVDAKTPAFSAECSRLTPDAFDMDTFPVDPFTKAARADRASDCVQKLGQPDMRQHAVVNNPNPADRLLLRVKPDKTANYLGKYYNGVEVTLIPWGLAAPGWSYVRIGDEAEGYMMNQFLAFASDGKLVASAMPEYELSAEVTLRYGPSDAASLKKTLRKGESVLVMGFANGWWHVRTGVNTGYIREQEKLDGN